MAITAAQVKELREMTGAGMMDCKKALTATEGDMDKAVEFLRKRSCYSTEESKPCSSRRSLQNFSFRRWKKAVVVVNDGAKNEKFQNYVADVAAQAMNTTAADIDAFLAEAWALDTTC